MYKILKRKFAKKNYRAKTKFFYEPYYVKNKNINKINTINLISIQFLEFKYKFIKLLEKNQYNYYKSNTMSEKIIQSLKD